MVNTNNILYYEYLKLQKTREQCFVDFFGSSLQLQNYWGDAPATQFYVNAYFFSQTYSYYYVFIHKIKVRTKRCDGL